MSLPYKILLTSAIKFCLIYPSQNGLTPFQIARANGNETVCNSLENYCNIREKQVTEVRLFDCVFMWCVCEYVCVCVCVCVCTLLCTQLPLLMLCGWQCVNYMQKFLGFLTPLYLFLISHSIQYQKEQTKQSYQRLLKILDLLEEKLLPSKVQKRKHKQSKDVDNKDVKAEVVQQFCLCNVEVVQLCDVDVKVIPYSVYISL